MSIFSHASNSQEEARIDEDLTGVLVCSTITAIVEPDSRAEVLLQSPPEFSSSYKTNSNEYQMFQYPIVNSTSTQESDYIIVRNYMFGEQIAVGTSGTIRMAEYIAKVRPTLMLLPVLYFLCLTLIFYMKIFWYYCSRQK